MSRAPLDQKLYDEVVAEAKRRFRVWPSAYASGWVVRTYKERGGQYAGEKKGRWSGLTKWYGETWVDLSRPLIDAQGRLQGYEKCGRQASREQKDSRDYPKCRPYLEAMRMSPEEVASAIRRKRAAEEKAPRGKGRAPVRVATYRKNPASEDAVEPSYVPIVGERHAFSPRGMYPFDAVVTAVTAETVTLAQTPPGEPPGAYGVKIPLASFPHFVNDLRGIVTGPPTGDLAVDAVLDGSAELLGKGDDGLAFRVVTGKAPRVVKVSTTVPYQPFNPNHLTPEQSAERMRQQHESDQAMIAAGIPAILPSRFLVRGTGSSLKAFLVKPWVEIPSHFTREQLDQAAASVEAAHRAGWVFRDEIQIGLWNGRVYHFDTGKAAFVGPGPKTDPDDYWSEAHTDVQNLKRLFSANGEQYLTDREKVNPIARFESLGAIDARSLSAEQRKNYRRQIVRLGVEIRRYLENHPGEDNGFWSSIPEYADDEIRDMMAKFKEPAT